MQNFYRFFFDFFRFLAGAQRKEEHLKKYVEIKYIFIGLIFKYISIFNNSNLFFLINETTSTTLLVNRSFKASYKSLNLGDFFREKNYLTPCALTKITRYTTGFPIFLRFFQNFFNSKCFQDSEFSGHPSFNYILINTSISYFKNIKKKCFKIHTYMFTKSLTV